jgi:TM2 domain-containing membrane protein YozV
MAMNDPQALMWYQVHKKETSTTFLLWFFLGHFGAHRFYMGRTGSAVAMLLLVILSIPLLFVVIGLFTYVAAFIWWIVDAFLICDWVKEHNMQLAHAVSQQQLPQHGGHYLPSTP